MIMQKKLLVLILTLATTLTFGQSQRSAKILLDTTSITFRDTIFNIAFDSTSHNLGNIIPTNENENNELVKKFKYLGADTIYIRKAWTGDPHFICEYPQEPLITNKIYSFTVCFFHKGRQGTLYKHMGFNLSDGKKITFKFTGVYLPIEKKINKKYTE